MGLRHCAAAAVVFGVFVSQGCDGSEPITQFETAVSPIIGGAAESGFDVAGGELRASGAETLVGKPTELLDLL